MQTLIDRLTDKLYEAAGLGLSKLIKPDLTLETIQSLTPQEIENLKSTHNIEALILDVDETLRTNMQNIPKCNQQWLTEVKKQLKLIVVSNRI